MFFFFIDAMCGDEFDSEHLNENIELRSPLELTPPFSEPFPWIFGYDKQLF